MQTSSNRPACARQSNAHEGHWHSDYCHEAQPMRHLPLLLIAALCLPCAASAQDTPATLEQALQAQDGDSHGDLRAVVVLREGAIVAARYYNGETADALHDIRSAGKSITALLLGAAAGRGSGAGPVVDNKNGGRVLARSGWQPCGQWRQQDLCDTGAPHGDQHRIERVWQGLWAAPFGRHPQSHPEGGCNADVSVCNDRQRKRPGARFMLSDTGIIPAPTDIPDKPPPRTAP